MDYFGRVVEELTDLWDEVRTSPHGDEAKPLLQALDRAMAVAARIEREKASFGQSVNGAAHPAVVAGAARH